MINTDAEPKVNIPKAAASQNKKKDLGTSNSTHLFYRIISKMTNNQTECRHCMKLLYGKKYTLKDNDAYCIPCYDQLFSNTCEACKQTIGCDSKDLSYKDRHWHEECFNCAKCNNSLVEKPFAAKDETLLCTECYSNEYSSKCFQCKKNILPGSRKMEFKGNVWHETCFVCQSCQKPIGTDPLISRESKNYCVPCFEKQFAPRCSGCQKVITTGGMTYRDEPWHKECFLCTGCNKQLFGESFVSKDDHPYCQDCFASLYAQRCEGCTKPITALGSPQYISFQERQWHSDCFKCGKCNASLVGQGFLTHQEAILCRECGSNTESEI
ncbi:four and a half LIM domains protein 5 isoform X1 [Sarcophilus harrisii]|uniref:Four and a half LIM domains protein 5 n=2 Tax=Sarcophilus harrisii TaxID=9305 RepID=A0A7N4NPE6_SARHA|nr:four and a half LIM domains protein 5 isoform X1 [Sarcophilus harrisii]